MLTNKDAMGIAQIIAEPGLFPEARKQLTRELLDYYKELLYRDPKQQIPTVRRMW
jgi:hypothetical protein